MIIILHGKDTYRSKEKLEEIIQGYKKNHGSGLNLKLLSEKSSLEDVCSEERQVSMFQEKRLLVIKNAFSSSSLKKDIIKSPEKITLSENIIIFYEENEIKENDDLFLLLTKEKETKHQKFMPFSKGNLSSWIEREFNKRGTRTEKDVIYYLMRFGGEDLYRIKNEIEKLSLYSSAVEMNDAKLLVKPEIEPNIFKMIDALAFGEKEEAVIFLYDHLEKGDNPLYLFSMIGYQFRNLLIVKSLIEKGISYKEAKKRAKLRDFVFAKSYKQAERFSYDELKKKYDWLFEIDLKVKTGQIDPVPALYLFIFHS